MNAFLWTFSFVILASTAAQPEKAPATKPPAEVMQAGERYLVERMGETFFDRCVRLVSFSMKDAAPCTDTIPSVRYDLHYQLEWLVAVPGRAHARFGIILFVSPDGRRVEASTWTGVPECAAHPEDCEFAINEARAIEIAQEAGLEPGVSPWQRRFRWGREVERYVWWVSNEVSEGEGTGLQIDGNTGEILQVGAVRIMR